jgi:hypothetical protein
MDARAVTPVQIQREVRRVAEMGYVPMPFTLHPLNPPYEQYNAVESWEFTLPEGDQETMRGDVIPGADPTPPPAVQPPPQQNTDPRFGPTLTRKRKDN